jgi:hypothetical protein
MTAQVAADSDGIVAIVPVDEKTMLVRLKDALHAHEKSLPV